MILGLWHFHFCPTLFKSEMKRLQAQRGSLNTFEELAQRVDLSRGTGKLNKNMKANMVFTQRWPTVTKQNKLDIGRNGWHLGDGSGREVSSDVERNKFTGTRWRVAFHRNKRNRWVDILANQWPPHPPAAPVGRRNVANRNCQSITTQVLCII